MHRHARQFSLVLLLLLPLSTLAGPFVLLLTKQDFDDSATNTPSTSTEENSVDLDDDPLDLKSVDELDPGSWRPIFEPDSESSPHTNPDLSQYYSSIRKMLSAVTSGDSTLMQEAGKELEATGGFAAQSVLGFLFGTGQLRETNGAKAFLHHHFASQGGSMQSKMAMAYTYYRQHMMEEAVELYAELAEAAVSNLLISKDPAIETIRIHSGTEENKEGLRKSRGEDDEEFQVIEYQAQKGNAEAMYRMGMFYYFGLRGLRRDYRKAVAWFLKAVVKGDPLSMEVLGEMYVRGVGVERNYTKAFEWLMLASNREHFSAYNGLGYLYLKGYGVEKNHTKAMEYFENAKENDETAAYYNLGMVYLRGIGVKKDIKIAREFFIKAAMDGQPKAYFQLAKMFHSGIGLRKNLVTATGLYKIVAERGPWSSLSRWALESYIKGEVGKALLLYSRLAELGYEVAQSNAAWILDKYGEHSMCFGGSGLCTDAERHRRTHDLWWRATEQRNEHAALLIGDAYYYGRGTDVDYERAAEAYMHARSQSNAQAMFNLGYMHEHGYGLPFDLHLAKRYYDQALESDPAAKLPVTLALVSLWIRQNYANSFLVNLIDSLPEVYPKVGAWVRNVVLDEGNVTILTLFVCLLTVLYLRERQRRHAAADIQQQPNDHDIAAPN